MEDDIVSISELDIECSRCGTGPDRLIPVWEDKENHDSGKDPKFVGCLNCHLMTEI